MSNTVTTSSSIVQTLDTIAQRAIATTVPKITSKYLVFSAGSNLTPTNLGTLSY